MAITPQVNGEASVWVGTGASNALQELGVSVDGIEMEFKMHTEPIKVDTYGPHASWDEQLFLEEALIKCQLIIFDNTVLGTVTARYFGGTSGVMPAAGTPIIAAAVTFPVVIRSTPSGTGVFGTAPCIKFGQCYTADSYTKKVGTKATVLNITFRALLNQVSGTSSGAVLYTFSCT